MNGWAFVNLLQDMHRRGAMARVRDALIREPATVKGLARELSLSKAIVSLSISFLRKGGFVIDNRDWSAVPGHNRKGTYHLVSTPDGGGGGTGAC